MRGTAVIASNTGGLAEVVVDGETGYLVPPGDANALRDRISAILSDKQMAVTMGKAGRERAMQSFQEARWIDSFLELYRSITGGKSEP